MKNRLTAAWTDPRVPVEVQERLRRHALRTSQEAVRRMLAEGHTPTVGRVTLPHPVEAAQEYHAWVLRVGGVQVITLEHWTAPREPKT